MRNKIFFIIIAAACIVIIHTGCAKKPSTDDKVLATVSNGAITIKDFEARIAKMPAYYRSVVDQNKKRYLEELIAEMLFYEEAVRQKVHRDKEVLEVLDDAKKKITIAKFIKNEVDDKVRVSDEEMRKMYEANKNELKKPALWRASHILVASQIEAKEIQKLLKDGANFEELAGTRSIDATAERGGDVGYFRLGQIIPDFEKACLKLDIGQTSGIIHTQFGYHIIKLTDKKEPLLQSYEEAKPAIEAELKRRKKAELFDNLVMNLKDKYGVKIEEDVFETIETKNKK